MRLSVPAGQRLAVPEGQKLIVPGDVPADTVGLDFHVRGKVNAVAQYNAGLPVPVMPSYVDVDPDGGRWPPGGGDYLAAVSDVARIEADGILIEPTRYQFCLAPDDLSDTDHWTAVNGASVAADQSAGRYGTTTMDRLSDAGSSADARIKQDFAGGGMSGDDVYVSISIDAREGTAPAFAMGIYDNGFGWRARTDFEWSGGVLQVKAEDVGTGFVRSLGGGLYRAYAVTAGTWTNANAWQALVYPTEQGVQPGESQYTDFGCVQIEEGTRPSNYINDEATQRLGDDIRYSAAGNVGAEGTVFLKVKTPGVEDTSNMGLLSLETDGANRMSLYLDNSSKKPKLYVVDGGVAQAHLAATNAIVSDTDTIITAVFASGNFRLLIDGGDEKTDASGSVPSASTVFLGSVGGGGQMNGNLSDVRIYNQVLSQARIDAVVSEIQGW